MEGQLGWLRRIAGNEASPESRTSKEKVLFENKDRDPKED